ncbi:LuxR C-terminal-related transcriptional regulator [Nocardia sp. NPDC056952]|uniref:response regulator transcription factor n=1 Tax=Nocardia sp. NPDC056952 TaxID=3345979 RepID=UPI0036410652
MPNASRKHLQIAAIDDHAIWVRGLSSTLPDFAVTATVAHYRSVPALLAEPSVFDLVILALLLGDSSTPAQNVARLNDSGNRVLVITSGARPDLVREATRTGVLGVVYKSEADAVIANAIWTAAQGGTVSGSTPTADTDLHEFEPELSPRERDVLALWASGETARGIAEVLELSVNTVNIYLRRVKSKYEAAGYAVHTKTDLRVAAHRTGIAPPPWWRPRAD